MNKKLILNILTDKEKASITEAETGKQIRAFPLLYPTHKRDNQIIFDAAMEAMRKAKHWVEAEFPDTEITFTYNFK